MQNFNDTIPNPREFRIPTHSIDEAELGRVLTEQQLKEQQAIQEALDQATAFLVDVTSQDASNESDSHESGFMSQRSSVEPMQMAHVSSEKYAKSVASRSPELISSQEAISTISEIGSAVQKLRQGSALTQDQFEIVA